MRRRPISALALVALTVGVLSVGFGLGAAAAGAPPEPSLPEETIAARERFFGAENVDPATGAVDAGEVHLSWVSVATFALALDGHVVLLDAYIHKEEDEANYVPATTDDLVALAPDAILIGHGHFDHALEAPRIAAETGAVMFGTADHCAQAAAAAPGPIDCRALFDGASSPGDVSAFDLVDGVCSSAVLHLHSAAEPPDPDHDHTDQVVPIPDPGSVLLHPPGSLFGTDGDEGGTVLYQLRVRDFTLTWHDSSGPLKENAPEVFDVLAGLPATDVQVGAILGFNQPFNGLRDPAMYIDAIDPTVFVPNHHDFVTEYGSADDYEPALRATLEAYDADPEIRFLYDPYDYVRPNLLSYRLDDARWAGPEGERCGRGGGAGPTGPRASAAPAAELSAAAPLPVTGGGLVTAGALLLLGWALGRRPSAG